MVIVLWAQANDSSKSNSSDGESLMGKFKRLLRSVRRRPDHPHSGAECSECEKRQDESLHELATRLHVLEWEAKMYDTNAARRKRKQP